MLWSIFCVSKNTPFFHFLTVWIGQISYFLCISFLICKVGKNSSYSISLLGGLNEIIQVKHLTRCQSCSQCPGKVSKRIPFDSRNFYGTLVEGLLAGKRVSGHWESIAGWSWKSRVYKKQEESVSEVYTSIPGGSERSGKTYESGRWRGEGVWGLLVLWLQKYVNQQGLMPAETLTAWREPQCLRVDSLVLPCCRSC